MADEQNKKSPGFAEVIDTVQKSSSDELAALARIERKLTGPKSGVTSASSRADANAAGKADPGVPRSVRLAEERKKQQENARRKSIKNQENGSLKSDKNPTKSSNQKSRLIVTNSSDKNQTKVGDSTVNVIISDKPEKKHSNSRNLSDKSQTNNTSSSSAEKRRRDALERLRAPNRPAGGRTRDENGRFTSRDKARENEAAKQNGQNEREREASDKKRDALFTRIGKMLSESSDPLDADATNAAGVAGGGSFWKAGHEVYSMAKGTVSGGVSGAQKMREFMGGKDGEEGAKKPGLMRRMFTRGKGIGATGRPGSASVVAANAQREQAKATEQQTEAIKDGDKQIVEKLDDLLKERHGSKSGGLWGMLGAMAMGKLGKKMLAGILGGLGAKALADRVRGGSRKRRKSLPGLGDDCGCDADLAGGGVDGKNKRKPTRKERREARRKAGKKGLFGRFGKKVAIAGGTAAAGTVVADAAADALASADTTRGKATTPETKAATKVAAKEAESVAATVAGTGAAAAAGKVAASKAATTGAEAAASKVAVNGTEATGEKVAVKAAEKTGTKLATKAVVGASLRALPVVGQVVGAGIDGVMGWRDKEGQQNAFNLQDGQEATKRQKAEYATANIVDMGGLVSGGAGLLAKGASALGFDNVAKKLTFSTDDIAKGIDDKVTAGKKAVKGATDFLGLTKPQNEQEKKDDARTQTLVTAIQDGAKTTVNAITAALGTGLTTVGNAASGAVESAGGSVSRFVAGFTQPTTDDVSPELNIGGANARNRNFRNNNFGNLVYAGQKGARLENANANGERRFARFDTPEEGIRGLGNQLMSYYNGTSQAVGYQKLQNIDQIISKFAPPNENNTKAYKASLSQQLGVGIGDKLDLQNPDVMTKVVRAISTVEGGNPQVTDDFIKTGLGQYQQGKNGKGEWVGQFNDSTLKIVNAKRAAQGQDALTRDAQFSGIATANGKSVDAVKAADVTPVTPPARAAEPAQHAQTAKKHHTGTTTQNGVVFRDADIPLGQNTGIGQKLASTEGLRHQTGLAPHADAQAAVPATDIDQQVRDIQAASQLKSAGTPATPQQNAQAVASALGNKPLDDNDPDVQRIKEASTLKPAGTPATLQQNIQAIADAQNVKPLDPNDPDLKRYQEASARKSAGAPASLQDSIQAIADSEKSGSEGSGTPAQAVSRPQAPSEGVKFRGAHLPGQDTTVGKWVMAHGGNSLANTEGLRHQVSPSSAPAAATSRPTMAIPSKLTTVTDMAANHVQSTVHVANEQSFPKEVKATFEKIAKSLERIEGHTKDTAEKSGDSSPKANTPQPAPRGSTPLSINDPLMASVAND